MTETTKPSTVSRMLAAATSELPPAESSTHYSAEATPRVEPESIPHPTGESRWQIHTMNQHGKPEDAQVRDANSQTTDQARYFARILHKMASSKSFWRSTLEKAIFSDCAALMDQMADEIEANNSKQ